jgi:hypothetical protein
LSLILRKVLQHRGCSFESLRYHRKTLDLSVFASTLELHIVSMELTLPSNSALVWGPLDSIRECHFKTNISRDCVISPARISLFFSSFFLKIILLCLCWLCRKHVLLSIAFSMYPCFMCLRSIVLDLVMYPIGRSQCPSVCPAKLV